MKFLVEVHDRDGVAVVDYIRGKTGITVDESGKAIDVADLEALLRLTGGWNVLQIEGGHGGNPPVVHIYVAYAE